LVNRRHLLIVFNDPKIEISAIAEISQLFIAIQTCAVGAEISETGRGRRGRTPKALLELLELSEASTKTGRRNSGLF
jgi:hypothetical protein